MRRVGRGRGLWLHATVVAACALCVAVPVASADTAVSVGIDPQDPGFDQPVTLTFTGTTNAPERLYAYTYSDYRAFGVCTGADSGSAPGTPNVLDGVPVTGFFSIPATVTFPAADDISNGLYTVCVWLAGPGSETAIGPPQRIGLHVRRPAEPKPVDTWLRSSYRLRAGSHRLAVTSQIVAFSGGPPRGRCVLEVYAARTWLYATPQAQIDGRGRCRFSIDAHHLRRRFRVEFIPAVGFKASIGAPAWVDARTRP
jgi:hypothetical protein